MGVGSCGQTDPVTRAGPEHHQCKVAGGGGYACVLRGGYTYLYTVVGLLRTGDGTPCLSPLHWTIYHGTTLDCARKISKMG